MEYCLVGTGLLTEKLQIPPPLLLPLLFLPKKKYIHICIRRGGQWVAVHRKKEKEKNPTRLRAHKTHKNPTGIFDKLIFLHRKQHEWQWEESGASH